jgi:hypothetical protein
MLVILPIKAYEELLNQAEDAEGVACLKKAPRHNAVAASLGLPSRSFMRRMVEALERHNRPSFTVLSTNFDRFSRPDHPALCLAEIDGLFEHARLARRAESAAT